MLHFLFFILFHGFSLNSRWDQIDMVNMNGGGGWGTWRKDRFCPDGSWVKGFRHLTDTNTGITYDDRGTIVVEISCFDLSNNKLATLSGIPEEDDDICSYYLTWSNYVECSLAHNFINGMNQKVGQQSVAVTGVTVKCVDGTELIPGNEYPGGSYQGYSYCPANSAICGIKQKYQLDEGVGGDDSALNDLIIYCCRTCDQASGRYVDTSTIECEICHYSCKTCDGGSSSNCLSCYHSGTPISNACPSPSYLYEVEGSSHSPSGWTGYPSTTLSDCGSFITGIFGGYNIFGKDGYAQKSYSSLPPHFKKRIRVRFVKIDSWDSEIAYVYLDSTQIMSKTFYSNDGLLSGSSCGSTSFDYDYVLETEQPNSLQSFLIKITTNLNELADDESWGFSDFYLGILKCDSTCASCSDQNSNSCSTCYPNASPTSGVCSCNDCYYMVITSNCVSHPCSTCLPCYNGCKKCTGSNIGDCQSCIPGFYYFAGICYFKYCPGTTYGNNATLTCDVSCNGISQYLDLNDRICKSCNPTCLTCSEKLNTNCHSCSASYFLSFETPNTTEGKCISTCLAPSFAHFPTRTCWTLCPTPTWGVVSERVCRDDCLGTNWYKDLADRICKICHPNCLTCSGPLDSDCLTCGGILYLNDGKCLSECAEGKYGDSTTNTCKNCSTNCKSCKTPNEATTCLTCPVNNYLSTSNNICKESACKSYEYRDFIENKCKQCHSACFTCFGGTASNCLTCTSTLYHYEPDNTCVSECPVPYYAYATHNKCYVTCPTNYYGINSSRTCEMACENENNFADPSDRICRPCHSECNTCNGITNHDCMSCDSPRFLKFNICVLNCGSGFYGDLSNKTCKPCQHPCKTCVSSPSDCLECNEDNGVKLFKKENFCVINCGEGYFLWFDSVCRPCNSKKCVNCHESCKTCNGETSNQCLSCWDSSFLKQGQCVTECGAGLFRSDINGKQECSDCSKPGEYIDAKEGKCKACPAGCETCSENGCIKCFNNLFAIGFECLPPSTHSCNVCESRIPDCIQCGAPELGCFKCRVGYYPLDKEGDKVFEECTKCTNTSLVKVKEKCVSCDKVLEGCLECFNNENTCFSCKEGYFLSDSSLKRFCQKCDPDCPCQDRVPGCSRCVYHLNMKLTCIECQTGLFLIDFDKDSIVDGCMKCNEFNQYIDFTRKQCLECSGINIGCLNCHGDPKNCTECNKGFYKIKIGENILCSKCLNINETLDVKRGICYSCQEEILGCQSCEFNNDRISCLACDKGFMKIDSSCEKDCFSLKKKFDINKNKCVDVCGEGYFEVFDTSYNQIVCKNCSNQCNTCSEKEDLCQSCSSNRFLFNNTCIEKCPTPFKENNIQRRCTRCSTNEYEEFENNEFARCLLCEQPCTSCIGGKYNCTSCQKELFLNYNHCDEFCPSGTYTDYSARICIKCDPDCKECDGRNNQSCTQCNKPLFLYSKQCLKVCPNGTFANEPSQQCNRCHFSCQYCFGPNEFQCLENCYDKRYFLAIESKDSNYIPPNIKVGQCLCKDGFFEKNTPECGGCHYSCHKCNGPYHTDCTSCAGNRGDKDKMSADGVCNCPPNTYEYMQPVCLGQGYYSETISLVDIIQNKEISQISFFSAVSLSSLNIFGLLFNVVEVAQEINLYCFLNTIKPLNLEGLLDFLTEFRFYRYLKIFSQLKIPVNNQSKKNNSRVIFEQEPPPLFSKKGLTSSFLSNAASILVLLVLCPLFLLLMTSISNMITKHRIKKIDDSLKKRNVLKNSRKSAFKQLIGTYNIFSFILSIVWIFYEALLILYIARVYLSMNPNVRDKLNIKKRLTLYIYRGENKEEQQSVQVKNEYSEEQKEKYSFFFGKIIKQDARGMSFFFYRIVKKVILPMIHVGFHMDINNTITILIVFYSLSYLYLRVVEPHRYKLISILAESTELLHINFLMLVKFYVYSVDLKNSEIALTLGLYMIYSILAIIFLNALSLCASLAILLISSLSDILKKKKKRKKRITKEDAKLTLNMNSNLNSEKIVIEDVKNNSAIGQKGAINLEETFKFIKENLSQDQTPDLKSSVRFIKITEENKKLVSPDNLDEAKRLQPGFQEETNSLSNRAVFEIQGDSKESADNRAKDFINDHRDRDFVNEEDFALPNSEFEIFYADTLKKIKNIEDFYLEGEKSLKDWKKEQKIKSIALGNKT